MAAGRTQIRLGALTGSLDDGGDFTGPAIPYAESSLQGSLDRLATSIKLITGKSSFSTALSGTFYQTLKSDTVGNVDLGSTTDADKFGTLFVANKKGIKFGNAEQHSIMDEGALDGALAIQTTGSLLLESSGGVIVVGGDDIDQNIDLGTDGVRVISVGTMSGTGGVPSTSVNLGAAVVNVDGGDTGVTIDALNSGSIDIGTSAVAASQTSAINIGTNAHARAIAVGSILSTHVRSRAAAVITEAGATGVTIDALNTASVNLGTSTELGMKSAPVNIGTNNFGRTITVGNALSTEVELNAIRVDINAAANGFQIDGAGASSVGTSVSNLTLNATSGSVILTGSAGSTSVLVQSDLTVSGDVILSNNLTVNGTTTTVNTDNLTIEDQVIAMAYSGSTGFFGPAGDRGIMMGIKGEQSPSLVWSDTLDTFALCRTATSPSASMGTIALSADADLRVKDLQVRGGNLDLTTAITAIDLFADASGLEVKVGADVLGAWNSGADNLGLRGLKFGDMTITNGERSGGSSLWFGAGLDMNIYSDGLNSFISGSTTGGNVSIGTNNAGKQVNLEVQGASKLNVKGTEVQIMQKLVGPASASLHVSSSAGQPVLIAATGEQIQFWDGNKLASSWTQANPMLFSAGAAEWSNFETNFGEVSLLAAINKGANLADNALKKQFPLTTTVASGSKLSTGTGATTFDASSLTPLQLTNRCDVFVNGQLMHSGSAANVGLATPSVDYVFDFLGVSGNASDLSFSFAIEADDVVSVCLR